MATDRVFGPLENHSLVTARGPIMRNDRVNNTKTGRPRRKSELLPRTARATHLYRDILFAPGWYYPENHHGVARFARNHAWHITADLDDPAPVNWKGDGVLTLLTARHKIWERLRTLNIPIVDLTESRPEIAVPRVIADNAAVGRLAAEYYLNRGYRHFAYVHRWDLGVSLRRREHFRTTVTTAGCPCALFSWQSRRGDQADTRENRVLWLMQELSRLPKPVAVLASRDAEAIEVLDACFAANLPVPEHVAVLGVDNQVSMCESLRVPLSSIDTNLELIGYSGAALLESLMRGEPPPPEPVYILPVGIVERQSTNYLAIRHPVVVEALRYIHANAAKPIGMKNLLRAVNRSRSGLEKAFHENFIRTPMEELRHARLELAKKMLVETTEKIAVIAQKSGYETPQHFCHTFRKMEGVTPKQFRALRKSEPGEARQERSKDRTSRRRGKTRNA
jgi:LacI family transcriptional regulator